MFCKEWNDGKEACDGSQDCNLSEYRWGLQWPAPPFALFLFSSLQTSALLPRPLTHHTRLHLLGSRLRPHWPSIARVSRLPPSSRLRFVGPLAARSGS
jgi:hypothetical protein